MSEPVAPKVRKARPDDAADAARIVVESWQDVYPGVLPLPLLEAMTLRGQTTRWRKAMADQEQTVLVAQAGDHRRAAVVGVVHFGPVRDGGLDFPSEIYALCVDPARYGRGVGRALFASVLTALARQGVPRCLLWTPAGTSSRYFCAAMGGKPVAERKTALMGRIVPEIAYGWQVPVGAAPRQSAG